MKITRGLTVFIDLLYHNRRRKGVFFQAYTHGGPENQNCEGNLHQKWVKCLCILLAKKRIQASAEPEKNWLCKVFRKSVTHCDYWITDTYLSISYIFLQKIQFLKTTQNVSYGPWSVLISRFESGSYRDCDLNSSLLVL